MATAAGASPFVAGTRVGAAGPIVLPQPPASIRPLSGIGLRRDNLLRSVAPGRVGSRERVIATVGPDGGLSRILERQQVIIMGTGGYAIRERGPARSATALAGTLPPLIEFGTVVWQGFSPGRRTLSAQIVLSPGLESPRLPMRLTVGFTDAAGRRLPLTSRLAAPSKGRLTVTLTDEATAAEQLPAGAGNPAAVAEALDRLRRAAGRQQPRRPPTAGHGLPRRVGGRRTGETVQPVSAALLINGRFTASRGGSLVGPGTTPGVRPGTTGLSGILDTGTVSFTAQLHAGERVGLQLRVTPTVDPRLLAPPAGFRTWRSWAASHPSRHAVRAATATLVEQAAAAAKASEYVPYLPTGVSGNDTTSFDYRVAAPPPRLSATGVRVSLRPGAIGATAAAVAAILLVAAALRRYS